MTPDQHIGAPAPLYAGVESAIEQLLKDALSTRKDALSTRKNRKNRKKNIPSIKDVVNLCRGVDTEVHSPQCLVTEWQGLPCHTALYRFSARLSSAVSGEPFDRSSSNLDTSIIRPFPFMGIKKKSKKFEKIVSALWRGGRKRKRWVTSLTSPYLRQMRRGSIHHASIESTLCGACRHRLQPPRGPCVGYLIDKVVRLHVLSDVR